MYQQVQFAFWYLLLLLRVQTDPVFKFNSITYKYASLRKL